MVKQYGNIVVQCQCEDSLQIFRKQIHIRRHLVALIIGRIIMVVFFRGKILWINFAYRVAGLILVCLCSIPFGTLGAKWVGLVKETLG